jgi:hypothetical protein
LTLKKEYMDRREALRRTAWMVGGTLAAPTIMAVLKGCKAQPDLAWKPVYFTPEQAGIVNELAEVILPKTDTPGAIEVGVPSFIEQVVKDCYTEEDQNLFASGLKAFDEGARQEYGDGFVQLEPEQRTAFANKVFGEAGKSTKQEDKSLFILKMRELTLAGFFTSEAGATQVLQYEAVPGAYKGCIPLSEAGNGKTWAL